MMSKAERTKKFIIQKVAPVFNKQGYAGTALSDIEIATGLTKGAIYGNFKNKDELAVACFEYNITPLQKGIHKAIATTGGCFAQLEAMLGFYQENYDKVAATGGCPLLNSATEADDTLPFLKEKVQQSILKWEKELSAIIKEGQNNGVIKQSIDPESFSISMIALIEGGIMLAKAMNHKNYFLQALSSVEEKIERELKIN